uniref:Uncharacterized protein n=1 Tax=Arundo donax TaxID=35708 RepID=A0A0A8ZPB5_ARUDO
MLRRIPGDLHGRGGGGEICLVASRFRRFSADACNLTVEEYRRGGDLVCRVYWIWDDRSGGSVSL